jgi:alkylation response protein AidB-like acyl-CoA dehydrogenase
MTLAFRIDSDDERAFRAEVREFLAANLPDDLRGLSTRPPFDRAQWWFGKIAERGWVAPHWPKKFGGMEATINQQIILREEYARAGAPEISAQGLNHIGPLLMEYGTEAQKALHLPKILSGEVNWCQGYSEPNSGSDLASLKTRAVEDGDDFLITGQKIWTTWAQHSQWMFALVRSDPDAKPKQAGITFILVELATPGITVNPIRTIAGDDEFAEVFLDSARVPKTNVVGEVGEGWRVANSLLAHERLGTANPTLCFNALDRVRKVAGATGAMDDPAFRDRLARAELETVSLAALFAHAVSLSNAEHSLGPDSSIMKIASTETLQRVADLLVEAAAAHGADAARIDTPDGPVDVATLLLQCRRATIYGGSSEIQRNIVSKRVLGLPS